MNLNDVCYKNKKIFKIMQKYKKLFAFLLSACIIGYMVVLSKFLEFNPTYKSNYVKNNTSYKEQEWTDEKLFHNIYSDSEIVFNCLNIPPNKFGYRYWKDAIFLNIFSEDAQVSICNDIYPAIAAKYGKTPASVERAMRLCFENSMYYCYKKESNFIVKYLHDYLLYPHNSEILAKVSELVTSEEFQKNKFKLLKSFNN